MPWEQPFDSAGRMHGAAMALLIGGTPAEVGPPIVTRIAGDPICVTKVGRSAEPTVVKAKDSCDWDPVLKQAFGTEVNVSVETKVTIEGYFKFSTTPSQVIAKLYGGQRVYLEFLPDRVNALWAGYFNLGNYKDDFDTAGTDMTKFTLDATLVGKPTLGDDITEPA